MRFNCAVACALVAIDCFGTATGHNGPGIFAPAFLWLWWIIGGIWAVMALQVAARGAP